MPQQRSSTTTVALGFAGALRFCWTQLTSMRTALMLLFLLAVEAIPGGILPQRKISPVRVSDFITRHTTMGPLYDKVGLFSVYTSVWFSATYLLLFLSLIGCIIPRIGVYARTIRARPPHTPRYLHRLPAYYLWKNPAVGETAVAADSPALSDGVPGLLSRAHDHLRKAGYRVAANADGSISAERGYLREAGNLIFHVSLVLTLLAVAFAGMTRFEGSAAVPVGQSFSNSRVQYDDFTAGPLFKDAQLHPFAVRVNDFTVKYETGPVQRGAARAFKADVTVTDAETGQSRREPLEVNQPITVGGAKIHLIAYGFALNVTVKGGDGRTAFSGPVIFLPQDGNFLSAGAIKAFDAKPFQLGFEGIFLPSAVYEKGGPRSVFPDALNPQLLLNAWYGAPSPRSGQPSSVYSLNKTGMTQIMNSKNRRQPFRFILRPGYQQKLPGGKGTIQFNGIQRWVKLQVSDTRGADFAIAGIGLAVFGLCLSLFIRPRRIWVRAQSRPDGTRIEIAGLDRVDGRGGITEAVASLVSHLSLPAQDSRPSAARSVDG